MLGVGQPSTLVGQLSHGPTRLPAPLVVLHCLVKCFQRRYDKANHEIGLSKKKLEVFAVRLFQDENTPGPRLKPDEEYVHSWVTKEGQIISHDYRLLALLKYPF